MCDVMTLMCLFDLHLAGFLFYKILILKKKTGKTIMEGQIFSLRFLVLRQPKFALNCTSFCQ